jgi:hypothetical protein
MDGENRMNTHHHPPRPCYRVPDIFPNRCANLNCLKPLGELEVIVTRRTSFHEYEFCSVECVDAGENANNDLLFKAFQSASDHSSDQGADYEVSEAFYLMHLMEWRRKVDG